MNRIKTLSVIKVKRKGIRRRPVKGEEYAIYSKLVTVDLSDMGSYPDPFDDFSPFINIATLKLYRFISSLEIKLSNEQRARLRSVAILGPQTGLYAHIRFILSGYLPSLDVLRLLTNEEIQSILDYYEDKRLKEHVMLLPGRHMGGKADSFKAKFFRVSFKLSEHTGGLLHGMATTVAKDILALRERGDFECDVLTTDIREEVERISKIRADMHKDIWGADLTEAFKQYGEEVISLIEHHYYNVSNRKE